MIRQRAHLLAALCAIAMTLMFSAAARADTCNTRVIDAAGVFGSSGLAQVNAAALRLQRAGADVRVRTLRSLAGYPTLDAYEAAMRQHCASWRAPNGNRKSNLIVMLMALRQRKAGMFYGSAWSSRLDGRWPALLSGTMGPRFADHDFAGGFIAGLNSVHGLIIAPVGGTRAAGPTTVINQKPANLTGLWWVLGIGLGLVALILLFMFLMRAKRERDKRKAMQQEAKLNRTAVASNIEELDRPITMLGIKVNDVASKIGPKLGDPLKKAFDEVQHQMDAATARYGELDHSASDPNRDGLSTDEYDQIATAYDGVLDMIHKVQVGKNDLEKRAGDLKKMIDQAPAKIAEAEKHVADAKTEIDKIAEAGYRTDGLKAELQKAEDGVAKANAELADRQFGKVISGCADAITTADKAAADAKGLPGRKQSLDSRINETAALFDNAALTIAEGRKNFQYMSENFSEKCWSVVRGNGSEAEKRLVRAKKAGEDAKTAASMEEQRWDDADAKLDEAKKLLDSVDSLITSITERRAQLDRAKKDIASDMEAARKDIDAAAAYEKKYDDDIDDALKGHIAKARALLKAVRDDMASSDKPDYITAMKAVMDAHAAADRILDTARNQHEAMERKRQKLAATVREAERSISAAEQYIQDHSSDVDSDASARLGKAKSHMAQYTKAADLDTQLKYAEMADQAADAALDMAQRDFNRAENARQQAREQARLDALAAAEALEIASRPSYSSSYDDSWGSSFGGGGGGSSGFDDFGGGGGGSSGFDDFGGGGGGSFDFGDSGGGGGGSSDW